MVRVFISKAIQQQLHEEELKALVDDFKQYKNGQFIATFGRDVPYDHPNTPSVFKLEQIQHLHIIQADKKWSANTVQFQKTSDVHLVYCPCALCLDCFLLISILSPNAHELAKTPGTMGIIGEIAERFRQKF